METKCIQFKFNDKIIKIEGVSISDTSSLTDILKVLDNKKFEKEIKEIFNTVKNFEKDSTKDIIIEETDYTTIGDYKVGNISLLTINNIMQSVGNDWSKQVIKMLDILKLNGHLINGNNFLITNTSESAIYIGQNRNLIELPKNFTELDILKYITFIYIDKELSNYYSNLTDKITKIREVYEQNNSISEITSFLNRFPDTINKNKRFLYYIISNNSEVTIQNELIGEINNDLNRHDIKNSLLYKYFPNEKLFSLFDITNLNQIVLSDTKTSVDIDTILKIRNILDKMDVKNEVYDLFNEKLTEDFKSTLYRKDTDFRNLSNWEKKWYKLYTKQTEFSEFNSDTLDLVNQYIIDNIESSIKKTKKLDSNFISEIITIPIIKDTNLKNSIDTDNINFDINLNVNVKIDPYLLAKPNNRVLFFENKNAVNSLTPTVLYIDETINKGSHFYIKIKDGKVTIPEKVNTKHVSSIYFDNVFTKKFKGVSSDDKILVYNTLREKGIKTISIINSGIDLTNELIAAGFNVSIHTNNWFYNNKYLTKEEFINLPIFEYAKKADIKVIQPNSYNLKYSFLTNNNYNENKFDKSELEFKTQIEDLKEGKITQLITGNSDIIVQSSPFTMIDNNGNEVNLKIVNREKFILPRDNNGKLLKDVSFDNLLLNNTNFDNTSIIDIQTKTNLNKDYILKIIQDTPPKVKSKLTLLTVETVDNNHTPVTRKQIDNFSPEEVVEQLILDMGVDIVKFTKGLGKNGYVKDGVIYVNSNNLTANTLIHELSHLLFAGMKVKNQNLYISLLDKIDSESLLELKNTPTYKNLSELDLREEFLIRQFSDFLTNKVNDYSSDFKKLNFSKLLQDVFKLEEDVDDTTYNLARMTIENLMYTYGSNYNNLFKNLFPTNSHIQEMRLSNLKEDLIEKEQLIEDCTNGM